MMITTQQTLPLYRDFKVRTKKAISSKPIRRKYSHLSDSLATSIQTILSAQNPVDKDIQRTRKILGAVANDLSDEEIRDIVTKIQYLTDTWLDEFERQIFNGKTIQELLHERG